jgi:hypothetical protein
MIAEESMLREGSAERAAANNDQAEGPCICPVGGRRARHCLIEPVAEKTADRVP